MGWSRCLGAVAVLVAGVASGCVGQGTDATATTGLPAPGSDSHDAMPPTQSASADASMSSSSPPDFCKPPVAPGRKLSVPAGLAGEPGAVAHQVAAAFGDRVLPGEPERYSFSDAATWVTLNGSVTVDARGDGHFFVTYVGMGRTLASTEQEVHAALEDALARLGLSDAGLAWRNRTQGEARLLLFEQTIGGVGISNGGSYQDGASMGRPYFKAEMSGLVVLDAVALAPWEDARAAADRYVRCSIAGNETALATLHGPESSGEYSWEGETMRLTVEGHALAFEFYSWYGEGCEAAHDVYVTVDAQSGAILDVLQGPHCASVVLP